MAYIKLPAQCSNNIINFFDNYFLVSKQISITSDIKKKMKYYEKLPGQNIVLDSLKKHQECHRDFYRLSSYYYQNNINLSDLNYLLTFTKDTKLKKEIGIDLCQAIKNSEEEDLPIFKLLYEFYGANDLAEQEQKRIIERMKFNKYADGWEILAVPLIKEQRDIDFIRERHKLDINIINGKNWFAVNYAILDLASILARLGGKNELNFLVKEFEKSDNITKFERLKYLSYTKQDKAIKAIMDFYDKMPEIAKEGIITNHLSKCILELPKDTTTGKYDVKTVDKWLKKHRKNYKINVNSIQ